MVWGKFTDDLHENDKLGSVSDAAFRLWVLAITWSNKTLTDGHIPTARPPRLMVLRNPTKTIAELVGARLWHQAAHPCTSCLELRAAKQVTDPIPSGGYLVHHYHEYQPPAWKVKAEKERMRALGRAGGQKSGVVRSGKEAQRSSAPLPEDEDERSAALPDERSGTVKRTGEAVRLSGTVKRGASSAEHGPLQRSASPPYPRTPVPESVSSRTPNGSAARDPEPVDPEPDEPALPGAAGSVDPGVRREGRADRGLRHVGEVLRGAR